MSALVDFFRSYGLACVGLTLQFVAIILLLRGPLRRYLILLVYLVATAATTLIEMWAASKLINSPAALEHAARTQYMRIYYTDEIATDLLLFLVVILFTYRTLETSDTRKAAGKLLSCVVGIVVVLPFVIFREPKFHDLWYRHTSQLLNFGAALMNVVLWTALLRTKKRDPLLVTLSIGVGIMVTGQAIYFGLSVQLPAAERWIASTIAVITNLLGTYVWCQGLYRSQRKARALAAAGPPQPPTP